MVRNALKLIISWNHLNYLFVVAYNGEEWLMHSRILDVVLKDLGLCAWKVLQDEKLLHVFHEAAMF
jgi:hypothetical protein